MLSGSGGSTPRHSAGKESVTRLINNSCTGKSGADSPKKIATKIVMISPMLQDKRKCMAFFMLS